MTGPQCVKTHLAGKRLTTDADVKQAVTWLQALDCGLCYSRIQVLIPRWDNFLQFSDDNVEVWSDPSAAHCRVYMEVRIKRSASVCLSNFVLKLIYISSSLLWGWLAMSVFPSLKCLTHRPTLLASIQASPLARWSRECVSDVGTSSVTRNDVTTLYQNDMSTQPFCHTEIRPRDGGR